MSRCDALLLAIDALDNTQIRTIPRPTQLRRRRLKHCLSSLASECDRTCSEAPVLDCAFGDASQWAARRRAELATDAFAAVQRPPHGASRCFGGATW
jgi:hypothetical protein